MNCGGLEQELFKELVTSFLPQNIVNVRQSTLDFSIEVRIVICNHHPPLVAHVSLSKLLVLVDGFLNRLVSSLVAQTCVEFFSTIRRSDHVHDCVIAVVTEHHRVATHIV